MCRALAKSPPKLRVNPDREPGKTSHIRLGGHTGRRDGTGAKIKLPPARRQRLRFCLNQSRRWPDPMGMPRPARSLASSFFSPATSASIAHEGHHRDITGTSRGKTGAGVALPSRNQPRRTLSRHLDPRLASTTATQRPRAGLTASLLNPLPEACRYIPDLRVMVTIQSWCPRACSSQPEAACRSPASPRCGLRPRRVTQSPYAHEGVMVEKGVGAQTFNGARKKVLRQFLVGRP